MIRKLKNILAISLVTTSLRVKKNAEMVGRLNRKPNSKFWGFITISTPINPKITADHLLIPTFSFKKKNAYKVTINGAVINKV